jgi:hypothetical protein
MIRLFTKNATGLATDGRWYPGDINAIQDAVAAINDLTQALGVGSIALGESGLQFVRYGAGEARITGDVRMDGIVRALGGLYGGAFTTTQRDAIAAGRRPYGLIITNTVTNQVEWNKGTDAVPNWQPVSPPLVDGSVTAAKLAPQTIDVKAGSYTLVLGDRFKAIRMDGAGPTTLTIPTNAAQAFSVGDSVDVIQWGAGQVTIAGSAGVTVNGNPGLKTVGQYIMVTLLKMATDTWLAVGGLTP